MDFKCATINSNEVSMNNENKDGGETDEELEKIDGTAENWENDLLGADPKHQHKSDLNKKYPLTKGKQ